MALPSSFYSDVIFSLKSSTSCVDICRFFLGINVLYEGQAIHAPSFIRQGDTHPSFAVYHDHAFDFATSTSYDIFDLLMIGKGLSFPQAFQEISGKPLSDFFPHSPETPDPLKENIARLKSFIRDCSKNLDQSQSALDYLSQRGISHETALKLAIGFDPKTNRLIIPFFKNGSVRYYAGRDISGNQSPKYLYMTTELGCSKIPFGLQSIKPKLKRKVFKPFSDVDETETNSAIKSSTLILTEGLLDAVSLIQDGWQVLASGGGSFGKNNNKLVIDICRMYDKVCLAYDNDKAGQDFQLKIARWLIGENIPFVCALIPHSVDGHSVKDINDFFCAGGDFLTLVKTAQNGIAFTGSKLNTLKEIHEFVKSLAGYASNWDLQELFDSLVNRTKGSLFGDPDPANPDTMDATPLFSKGDLRFVFKSAGSKLSDKEIMRRVLKNHQIIFSNDGKFYEYNHRYWEQRTKETIKRYISHVIGERATESRCGAVMALMKLELEDDTPFNAQHVVTFPNGVLLLDEPDPEKRFVPHSPDFRCTFMEDFAFNTASKLEARYNALFREASFTEKGQSTYSRLHASNWWKFLASVFPKEGQPRCPDIALIREVQKMCGYIYFTDNRLETTFMLLGKGGNGKSTFMQIIEEVVGSEFCTHLRPNRLSSSFDPIVLRNSILNICHEASKDLEGAEETLKAVTSGNPIMASYKGQDTISFTPRAKWIISANSPMDVKDVSYGFARRMIFIPFRAKFDSKSADPDLLDKLRQEKSIIFDWMFEGYLRLLVGEKFKETPEQAKLKATVQEFVDHTLTFVREYFVEGDYIDCLDSAPGASGMVISMRLLPTDRTMYQWYLKWCKSTNTDPLPRYVAIVRINEAIGVMCPKMKIIRATERSTGRTRDTYVHPSFSDQVENIRVYDEDSQTEILKVFGFWTEDEVKAEKTTVEKITPSGESSSVKDNPAHAPEGSNLGGEQITLSSDNARLTVEAHNLHEGYETAGQQITRDDSRAPGSDSGERSGSTGVSGTD